MCNYLKSVEIWFMIHKTLALVRQRSFKFDPIPCECQNCLFKRVCCLKVHRSKNAHSWRKTRPKFFLISCQTFPHSGGHIGHPHGIWTSSIYLVLIGIISAGWDWDIGFDISMQLFSDLYTNESIHHPAERDKRTECTWLHLMDVGILRVKYLRKTRRLCRRCWTETCWRPLAGFWRWPSGWPASRCRQTPAAAPAHLLQC